MLSEARCKKCGGTNIYWKENHPDTGMDEMVMVCRDCKPKVKPLPLTRYVNMKTADKFKEKIDGIGKNSDARRKREDRIITKLRGLKKGEVRKLITMMRIMNDWILRLETHCLDHTGCLPYDSDIQERLNRIEV